MSEAITGVVKFAFGLISNKLRTYGAEKLGDGGLTDQKLLGMIVGEFDEIKSKLDAISRKDLLTSISSLQEGVISLTMSYGESLEGCNPSTASLPSADPCSVKSKPSLSSVTVQDAITLANVIGEMKTESNDRLESAKESFKEAGKKASEAFHNTALSVEKRILAAKVRIASRILEHLDDLEFAASKCLHCLRELNDMRAIQQIFSVDVKGGIKSVFKKDSRREIVESVAMVNWILADFISKFTKLRMAVFDWPMIQCGEQLVHPIHYNEERLPNLNKMQITPPWDIEVTGQTMICGIRTGHAIERLSEWHSLFSTGKRPQVYNVIRRAFDEDNTTYVLSGDEKNGYALSVYSADRRNTHHCTLEFLTGRRFSSIEMNVNDDKNIVFGLNHFYGASMVYLCNSNGKLTNSFDTGIKDHCIEFVSGCGNKVIVLLASMLSETKLHMYAEDGRLQNAVKLCPKHCDTNASHKIFYNKVTNQIISYLIFHGKILTEHFSCQTAELQHSYLLYYTNCSSTSSFDFIYQASGTLVYQTVYDRPSYWGLRRWGPDTDFV